MVVVTDGQDVQDANMSKAVIQNDKRKGKRPMKEMKVEIVDDLGIIGRNEAGYTKRLVLAKWYDKPPVYEIRSFAPDGTPKKRCGLMPEELDTLRDILSTM